MTDSEKAVLYSNLRTIHGDKTQQELLLEEMSELQQAITKSWRDIRKYGCIRQSTFDNLTEEIADVEIMLEQLVRMLGCVDLVETAKEQKLHRTRERLNQDRV